MKKSINLLLVFLIIISTLCLSASAEGGDGTGGGDGHGVPTLDNSSVPTGSTGVDTNVEITLTFAHNVANMSVKENNKTCFTLKDSDGNTGDFDVIIGDDQVDPTIKDIIKIQTQNLKPLTIYTLTISGDLKAKNGTKLGTPVSITFTTKGEPTTTKKPTGGGVYYPVTTAVATTTAPSTAPATTVSRRRPKVTTTAAAITNTTAKSIVKSTTKAPASSAIATTKSQEVIATQSEVTELTQAVLLVSSTGGETEGQTALTDLTPQTPDTISAGAENQSGSRADNIIVITLAAGAAAALAIVVFVKKKK